MEIAHSIFILDGCFYVFISPFDLSFAVVLLKVRTGLKKMVFGHLKNNKCLLNANLMQANLTH